MGRIVANFFISLDGVVESPDQWHFPYFDERMGAAIEQGMQASTGFLMGRVLYEEWAAYWTGKADDGDFGAFINAVPKYVVSDSLQEAIWSNTTLVSGDVVARLREIRDQAEGDIGMSGSATLVRWLLANGLLDELRLLVHPIVVGKGARLFADGPHPLRLTAHEAFPTGVLDLTYAPAGD